MQTTFSSLVAVALLASVGHAQTPSPAPATSSSPVVMPSTPAPAVAPATAAATPATPNQIVYTPRLPSAAELTDAAKAQGLAVERIEQSAAQIVATYRNSNGQVNVVCYQTLPPTGTPAEVVSVPASPPPTVVYQAPPRVVYYDYYDPFYYPYSRVWYPPVSVRFGVGFGHRGGFHHHH